MSELAKIKRTSLNYIDVGSGFPLLLGHSYLFSGEMWSTLLPALVEHYRLIIPDLWGHGGSPELPDGHSSLSDIANDHLALMDDLGITEFGILGISVGGMWGAELAALYPRRIKLLVLMGTFVGIEPSEKKTHYFTLLDSIDAAGAVPKPFLEYVVGQFYSDEAPESLLSPLRHRLQTITSERYRQSIVPLGKMIFGRKDNLPLLGQIRCPALVLTGEQDKPRPPEEGKLMASRLRCEHVVVPCAGNISVHENPEFVVDALLPFLQQHAS